MNKELFAALDMLEKEKGISKTYMFEKIEAALVSAFKKEYGTNANVRVLIDEKKEDIKVYYQKEVVEVVENPETQISLDEAKKIAKKYTLGSFVEKEVKPKNFRRLSAGAAKSVIMKGSDIIWSTIRKAIQDAYENQKEEIITATVSKINPETGSVLVETSNGFATLLRGEQIPGEILTIGDKIMVYILHVNKEGKGPIVTLTRTHSGLLKRLFELEIPEVTDGVVVVKSVAREAGSRSKIAVLSRDPDVDAVGACIGNHGMRINSIVKELAGEKIDIIKYSEDPIEYVKEALAPAPVVFAEMLSDNSCRVVVKPEYLSLAIGKEGQNVRLAAKLTGLKIDIKSE